MSNIEVGDIVKVVDSGTRYPTYNNWATLHDLHNYKKRCAPLEGVEYEVVCKGLHEDFKHHTILGIEDLNTKQQYIIGIKGVELVSKKEVKDYSHIKQGMYVLISELGDKKDEVVEAFSKAEGVVGVRPDFFNGEEYLGFTLMSRVITYEALGVFGDNPQQVSVDFTLNGPKKEVPDTFEEFVQHCIDNKEGFKVRVTPETSRLVQETVFKCGGSWCGGDAEVKLLGKPQLYLEQSLAGWGMTYEEDERWFNNHQNQEIIVEPVTTLKLVEVVKPKSEEDTAKEKREEKIKELVEQLEELRKLN